MPAPDTGYGQVSDKPAMGVDGETVGRAAEAARLKRIWIAARALDQHSLFVQGWTLEAIKHQQDTVVMPSEAALHQAKVCSDVLDTILPTLLLEAERKGAEKAADVLRWYAKQVLDCRKHGPDGDKARQELDADGGVRAVLAIRNLTTEQGDG